jgi:hypothetical protein
MATNRRELGGNRTIQLQIDYPDFDRHLAFLSPGETFAARTVAFCSTLLGSLKALSASVCVHLRLDRLNGLFASIRVHSRSQSESDLLGWASRPRLSPGRGLRSDGRMNRRTASLSVMILAT